MPDEHSNVIAGRFSPQKIIDQGETEQVGGTVVNFNLNRDENELDVEDAEPEE